MDKTAARRMRDEHSRDEAEMRRAQQRAAGSGHAPVEAYPQHGAQPLDCLRAGRSAVEGYEHALGAEQAAWVQLKSAPAGPAFGAAWHTWRSAVEDRDRATRVLINESLEQGGGAAAAA